MDETRVYEIRVEGHLDAEWSEWLDGVEIAPQEDGSSLLTGPVVDQSALYGLLLKLHDIGLWLISLQRVSPPSDESKQV
jgi:hypothetical protein